MYLTQSKKWSRLCRPLRATRPLFAQHALSETSVYNSAGDKIGEVEDVILDKTSNRIMFAAVSFGGFLGIGEKYHAVPWSLLDYVEDRDGYVVPLSKEQLEVAPADSLSDLTKNDGAGPRSASYDYYKVKRDW